jgi:hypothetical protein
MLNEYIFTFRYHFIIVSLNRESDSHNDSGTIRTVQVQEQFEGLFNTK